METLTIAFVELQKRVHILCSTQLTHPTQYQDFFDFENL